MKKKTAEFFKAFGAAIVIMLFLAVPFLGLVDAFAPRLIPDWMRIAGLVISAPFWIFIFATIAKEHREQKKPRAQGRKSHRRESPCFVNYSIFC